MKAVERQSNDALAQSSNSRLVRNTGGQYQKVFATRKRRLRGIWERNGAFNRQLTFASEETGAKVVRRLRLEDMDANPVTTIQQTVLNKSVVHL
ncbi:MAG: hypothetical protein WCS42_17815 [Verrucomicrobiota bacterium]